MLLPFQRFVFAASPSLKELHRKFHLLMEQKIGNLKRDRKTIKHKESGMTPLYTGAIEGDRFTINSHKHNGDEDIVKITGLISDRGSHLEVELRLHFTSSWLAIIAGSIVIALVAAYMYIFIGEKLFDLLIASPAIPYLLLVTLSVYINLRRYSNKAQSMIEHIIDWLELEVN